MIHTKTPTYGLEVPISRMQSVLETELTWLGVNNIYGTIFKNAKKDNVIAEAWVNNREYKQIFNNDKSTSQIGFLPLDRDVQSKSATVKIIVTIDLEKAYNAKIRDNERAYLQFQRAIEQTTTIIEDSFNQGIQDVFNGFKTDDIKYLDMQPYDCFSFNVTMFYPDNASCTGKL